LSGVRRVARFGRPAMSLGQANAPAVSSPPGGRAARRRLVGFWRRWVVWDGADLGDRRDHLAYLAILAVLVVGPAFLRFDPAAGERASVGPLELPPMCLSEALFHVPCPGCGLIRSFILIAHGHLAEAARYHRLGLPLYLFFMGQAALRLYGLRRGERLLPPRLLAVHHYAAAVLITLVVLNWAVGLFVGSN